MIRTDTIKEDYLEGLTEEQKFLAKQEFKLYESLADSDDANMMNNYGIALWKGTFIDKDVNKAIKFLEKAHENKSIHASWNLHNIYRKEVKDESKALEWLKISANLKNKFACCALANDYLDGKGVKVDYDEAMRLFKISAKQNHKYAQAGIGWIYENGFGVDTDGRKAEKWYIKSSDNGHFEAMERLAGLYYYGILISRDYVKAMKWYLKPALNNYHYSQYMLAHMYYYGIGAVENSKQAFVWLSLAKINGLKMDEGYKKLDEAIMGDVSDDYKRIVGEQLHKIYGEVK